MSASAATLTPRPWRPSSAQPLRRFRRLSPLPARHDVFAGPKPGLYFIDKEDVNQSNVQIVGLGTDRHNPDVPALAVMNEILGGGFASRLFQKIRTELGLAYAVGGGLGFDYDHPGPFRVEVLTQSAATVDATRPLWTKSPSSPPGPSPPEEVGRAKDNILNSFLFRYDTREKVLRERELLEFYGYPADYLETYKTALEKVTFDRCDRRGKEVHPPRQICRSRRGKRPGDQAASRRPETGSRASNRYHHSHTETDAKIRQMPDDSLCCYPRRANANRKTCSS